jgi:hypothetical protein
MERSDGYASVPPFSLSLCVCMPFVLWCLCLGQDPLLASLSVRQADRSARPARRYSSSRFSLGPLKQVLRVPSPRQGCRTQAQGANEPGPFCRAM